MGIIQTVDADVVFQGWADQWPENAHLETLCSCFGDALPYQGIGAKSLCQDMASLWIQLDIAWGGEVFLSNGYYILQGEK